MGTSQKVTNMGASNANFIPIQYLSYHTDTSKQTIINCAFNGKICMNQVNFTLKSFIKYQMSKTEDPKNYHFPHFLPKTP